MPAAPTAPTAPTVSTAPTAPTAPTVFGSETLIIDGRSVPAESTFSVVAPATGEVVATVPDTSADQLEAAIFSARRAQADWAANEAHRVAVLRRAADVLEEHSAELAELVSTETGKPLAATSFEVLGSVEHLRWAASVSLEDTVLRGEGETALTVEHIPVGVVAAIVPWNVPLVALVHKFAAASRVGNTVIAKPSPFTPLSALRLAQLLEPVVPPGVFTVLTGGDELGRRIVAHPGIDLVSLTGSVGAGKHIMSAAGAQLKRVVLELGGNDAAIVLPDADPDVVAEKLFQSAFIFTGQVCAAIKRLFLPRETYGAIVERLVKIAQTVPVGAPHEEGVVLGPLTTAAQLARIEELVEDARAQGGTILAGGKRLERPGYFYPPTIVTDLADDARLVAEEQFGPALPVLVYDDLEDAITRANASEYGLSASVWSPDVAKARRIARRLNAGTVWVNKHAVVDPAIPFGGVHSSGLGREGGLVGLRSYTELRTVDVGTL